MTIVLRTLILLLTVVPACADTWLWAWDRPEDLRWLPPGHGVAYFAAQFDAQGSTFKVTGRNAVLRVPPGTPLLPVLHIEAFDRRYPPMLGDEAVTLWADTLAASIQRLGTPTAPLTQVQIDFEARSGQRDFYRSVLTALRAKLPAGIHLSITALASWCGDPAWLASLPVDEVVPMYFRMGPAERSLWRQRMLQPTLLPAVCRSAAGLSIDEWHGMAAGLGERPLDAFKTRRLYLFAPKPWRASMLEGLPGWQDLHGSLVTDGNAP
ncbi:hypothetical protein [Chitinimonas naiadis]